MKVLVACEYSGIVRDAFAAKGHEALSCDYLPSETLGQHYQGSVFDVIDFPWDLGIFHFPCTDSSVSGARHFEAKKLDGRFYASNSLWLKGWRRAAHIPMVCFEHPISVISSLFRKPDQIIQPWQFGHGETKATCLWLKNTPPPVTDEHCKWARTENMEDGKRKRQREIVDLCRHCSGNGRPMDATNTFYRIGTKLLTVLTEEKCR